MNRYIYNYQTVVLFSQPVASHSILLRVQPALGAYMTVEEEHLMVPPEFHIAMGSDQLGNRIAYGHSRASHTSLVTVSAGMVRMGDYLVPMDSIPLMAYMEPTPITSLPGDNKMDLPSDTFLAAKAICHHVSLAMRYVPNVTAPETTVAEVAVTLRGVCQDYAHMMIALCRANGLAARYVCGFIEGEGLTHAWVEVCDGNVWKGFDPTHDVEIAQGYLKVAHGRDASDCPVSRGVFTGEASQQTDVMLTLRRV